MTPLYWFLAVLALLAAYIAWIYNRFVGLERWLVGRRLRRWLELVADVGYPSSGTAIGLPSAFVFT